MAWLLYITTAVLAVITIFTILWWTIVVKRRRILSKWVKIVPGIPIIGNVFDFGDNTETLNNLLSIKEKYGNLAYLEFLGHQLILCNDYEMLEFVLSSPTIITKAVDYDFFKKWLGTGLLISTGSKWKKRRRLITPAFHFSILAKYLETFSRNSTIMVDQLKKEVGKDIDIYSFVTLCTLDIICETAMGVSVNAQLNKESEYVKCVKEICRIVIDRAFSLLKGMDLFYMFSKDYYKERKILKTLHGFTNSVISKRIQELQDKSLNASKTNEEDDEIGKRKKLALLDLLLTSTVDGKPLTQEDIREEVDTFMFEGHDTTSSAITFTLYMLAEHPDVQMKAFEEQKAIFLNDKDRVPTYQDLQDMKYLEDVIKETLRLYPAVPVISRMVTEETNFKGNIIPKGVTISVLIYGINRDIEFHENPNKFDPGRFQTNDGKYPYSYIPFSAGPRNCIGQKFAMLELKSTISKILRYYELLPSKHNMILTNEAVLKSKNGVKIKLNNRNW